MQKQWAIVDYRRVVCLIVCCAFLTSVFASCVLVQPTGEPVVVKGKPKFAASRHSDVFHRISCHYVNRINDENLITFETREQAESSGKRGCKKCKPQLAH